MKKLWIYVIAIVLLAIGIFAFSNGFITGKATEDRQIVKMDVNYYGYQPEVLYVEVGIPARWEINVEQLSGCNRILVVKDYGIRKELKQGLNIIEFTPVRAGEIYFTCSMNMLYGKFIVRGGIN